MIVYTHSMDEYTKYRELVLLWALFCLGVHRPVVQSIVSLTSLLVVKMLTVLVSTIHRYFCWKNVCSFCKCKSYSHFSSKSINIYAIFNDQSFNDMLTKSLVLNWAQVNDKMSWGTAFPTWLHMPSNDSDQPNLRSDQLSQGTLLVAKDPKHFQADSEDSN